MNIDKRTNTLIIKDIASVIDEATALIKAIDTQTPQVMIESKIVEATLDFAREFGVMWGFGVNPLTTDQIGNDAFHLNRGDDNNVAVPEPGRGRRTRSTTIGAFLLDEKLNLNLQLQAAESTGDGKVISSPRLVTLDNSPAKIEQGVSIPFQTFENGDAQLEFVDAVLSLNVTPHITADRSIIMKVKVSRNAPDASVVTLTGSPAIAKNQVDTETLVKDGQTLVIGGIYVVDTSQKQGRVPYLHSIPLLGALFRSDAVVDKRKELLIFVTPRIVVGPAIAELIFPQSPIRGTRGSFGSSALPILPRVAETRTVWLVGMMGAGKSTIGPKLARRLGRRFIDTDAEVERAAGRRVSEIFQRDGEPAFRRLEREAIEACCGEAAVVALGGGAIEPPGARERLASTGTVVYLRARPETLLARVGDARRPAAARGARCRTAQAERLSELLAQAPGRL